MVSCWSCRTETQKLSHFTSQERDEMNKDGCHQSRKSPPKFNQNLNSLPNSIAACDYSGSQQNEPCVSGNTVKKRQAASEHIAKIALKDLAKYFNLPMLEASRNLKGGLTVLEKKCREFGIPRWPHRKIKYLDGLIHELQEVGWQQQEHEAAATAVAKRRLMLEEEKECIERKPCMETHSETKKFRQDIFKRRHRARVHKKQA